MKTTFKDFEKTTLYANIVKTYDEEPKNREEFLVSIETSFLVGHQLGLDEARAILEGEKISKPTTDVWLANQTPYGYDD